MDPLRIPLQPLPAPPPWPEVFGREAPLEVDVGFGRGHFLTDRARQAPHVDVVGIEYRRKWVETVGRRIAREGIRNGAVFEGEAVHFITEYFNPGALSRVYVFFPDPWWKRRHRKRRLLSPAFAALLTSRLGPDGEIFFQTDVREYADDAVATLGTTPGLVSVHGGDGLGPWTEEIPLSPRERRYRKDRVPYFQMQFRRESV